MSLCFAAGSTTCRTVNTEKESACIYITCIRAADDKIPYTCCILLLLAALSYSFVIEKKRQAGLAWVHSHGHPRRGHRGGSIRAGILCTTTNNVRRGGEAEEKQRQVVIFLLINRPDEGRKAKALSHLRATKYFGVAGEYLVCSTDFFFVSTSPQRTRNESLRNT